MFNRIYEEWKLQVGGSIITSAPSSIESMRNGNYCIALSRATSRTRSIESMRNGNLTHESVHSREEAPFNRIYEEWKLAWSCIYYTATGSSIESMRNGNSRAFNDSLKRLRVQSNLWGMETDDTVRQYRDVDAVQSNLWGMETKHSMWNRPLPESVQSNLWGMETAHAKKSL